MSRAIYSFPGDDQLRESPNQWRFQFSRSYLELQSHIELTMARYPSFYWIYKIQRTDL